MRQRQDLPLREGDPPIVELDYANLNDDALTVVRLWFAGADGPMQLADVHPRLLSETIRQVDQIVTTTELSDSD